MYLLHIGKNIMVKSEDIIGIFRTCILENTKEYEELIKNKQIEDVSLGTPKSFILSISLLKSYLISTFAGNK